MQKKALTLLEVIISVVILSLVITGLVHVFIVGKRYIEHSRCRVTAAEYAKRCLDPLWQYVRQDQWASPFGSATLPAAYTFRGVTYTPTIVFSDVGSTGLKRAVVTISWNEAQNY